MLPLREELRHCHSKKNSVTERSNIATEKREEKRVNVDKGGKKEKEEEQLCYRNKFVRTKIRLKEGTKI